MKTAGSSVSAKHFAWLKGSFLRLLVGMSLSMVLCSAHAQQQSNDALQLSVNAVYGILDQVAIRQGNEYTTHFIVRQAAPNAPVQNNPFTPMLTPKPAAAVMQQGFIKIETYGPLQAEGLRSGPGSDWNTQVSMRIKTYCFAGPGGAWGPTRYQQLNFLQWTVASSMGRAQVLIQPSNVLTGSNGGRDEGLPEYIAALFGVDARSVTVQRPSN